MRPLLAVLLLLSLAGCGGSSVNGSSGGGVTGQLATLDDVDPNPVVTITAEGVSPSVTHLERSVGVTFVNRDTVPHTFSDAPDLGYGECPEARSLGTIAPSQEKVLVIDREDVACAFRDTAHSGGPPFAGLLLLH
jgi:hypothetical protein